MDDLSVVRLMDIKFAKIKNKMGVGKIGVRLSVCVCVCVCVCVRKTYFGKLCFVLFVSYKQKLKNKNKIISRMKI